MANPKTKGRMLNKDISDSHKFAKLSPHAAVLFCMIIPHLNSYGKVNGGVGFIKDEICPLIPYLNTSNINKLLKEITDHTSMKWFESDGRHWIHSTNFLTDHQTLDSKKLGLDLLPTYSRVSPDLVQSKSGTSPELVQYEVEVEVEVEEIYSSSGDEPRVLISYKKRRLEGKRLDAFLLFWDAFDYKSGKSKAVDSWLDISVLTKADVDKIVRAAEMEAKRRPSIIAKGATPKMAQGWLSEKRWEDETISPPGFNTMAGVL